MNELLDGSAFEALLLGARVEPVAFERLSSVALSLRSVKSRFSPSVDGLTMLEGIEVLGQ